MDVNTHGLIDSVLFPFLTCSMGGDNTLTSRAPDTLLENSCQITREEISKLLTHGCTFPSKYKRQFLGELYVQGNAHNFLSMWAFQMFYLPLLTFYIWNLWGWYAQNGQKSRKLEQWDLLPQHKGPAIFSFFWNDKNKKNSWNFQDLDLVFGIWEVLIS